MWTRVLCCGWGPGVEMTALEAGLWNECQCEWSYECVQRWRCAPLCRWYEEVFVLRMQGGSGWLVWVELLHPNGEEPERRRASFSQGWWERKQRRVLPRRTYTEWLAWAEISEDVYSSTGMSCFGFLKKKTRSIIKTNMYFRLYINVFFLCLCKLSLAAISGVCFIPLYGRGKYFKSIYKTWALSAFLLLSYWSSNIHSLRRPQQLNNNKQLIS